MQTVFSYIRFSSKEQEQGDSIRRQKDLRDKWLARHADKYVLDDSVKLEDLGIAAFRGKNLDKNKGDLGKFIALVEDGAIPPGSVLMLENLDRFTRAPVGEVHRILYDLVKAGVQVLTLEPEMLITKKNVDDMSSVIPVIVYMQLSFEESRKKSDRLGSYWKHLRETAQTDCKPLSRKCPGWLQWEYGGEDKYPKAREGRFVVIPEAAAAVVHLFKRTAAGIGRKQLARELNAKYKPLGKLERWNESFIQKVLSERMVLGEYQPMRYDHEKKKRVPEGEPVKGYFPRIVSDDLYLRATASKKQRASLKGPRSGFINLLTGLMVGLDGYKCHTVSTKPTNHYKGSRGKITQRRVVSAGHSKGLPDACPISINYYALEKMIVEHMLHITTKDLTPTDAQDEQDSLSFHEQELARISKRLADLNKGLASADGPVVESLTGAINKLSERRKEVQAEIDACMETKVVLASDPVKSFRSVLAHIEQTKDKQTKHNLRLKLRSIIGQMVAQIIIDPIKDKHRTTAGVAVILRSGKTEFIGDIAKILEDEKKFIKAMNTEEMKKSFRKIAAAIKAESKKK
jgi:DNA invertase Pin-like site-specific DNA recombinase